MNSGTIKRTGVLLLAGILLLLGVWRPAAADADAEELAELYGGKTVDLGTIPEETLVEQGCDILLVVDTATGILMHEKNILVQMPVNGAVVQLMSALVALDYLNPDDLLTITAEHIAALSKTDARFGLLDGSQVYVSDLLASMLLTGAVDSAVVVIDAVLKKSHAPSMADLMSEKATSLGMTSTDYSTSSGMGDANVMTTALDQYRLYMAAMQHGTLAGLLKNGSYNVRSKDVFSTPTPISTPDAKAEKPKKTDSITDQNKNIPAVISNEVVAVVPDNAEYDVRLSYAIQSSVEYAKKRYGVVFYRAIDYRSDNIYIYWNQQNARRVLPKTMSSLVEVFSRRQTVNLVPYIQALTPSLSVEKNGVSISGWSIAPGYELYGRLMSFYEPDDPKNQSKSSSYDLSTMSVRLQPDANTMVTNADGSRTLDAIVLVNNVVADTVKLSTASKTNSADPSVQTTADLYTDDDVMPEQPTLMSQYGWVVLVAGAALLAMIVIIIGVLIRNRLER